VKKLLLLFAILPLLLCAADSANQLHFALRADPKTLDPLMVT